MSRKASGFRAWLVQRISAIYLAVYFIYLFIHFSISPPVEYVEWRSWLTDPIISISLALFFLALLMHAWIGIRDVVIDYVHPLTIRLTVLTAIAILLAGCGFLVMRTLILVAL